VEFGVEGDGGAIMMNKNAGVSIYLIKDSTSLTNGQTSTMSDIDGNVYPTVCIGTTEIMAAALKVEHYNDGTPIPNITNNTAWAADTAGAMCYYNNDTAIAADGYCWYNNDIANKEVYGGLFNKYAVDSVHGFVYFERNGVQETGWRVTNNADLAIFIAYMGGASTAGGKLKEVGLTHWTTPNLGATDEVGFKALPAGIRSPNSGTFMNLGLSTQMWTQESWDFSFAYDSIAYAIADASAFKGSGYSVRCVRDVTPSSITADNAVITVDDNIITIDHG
jgi:uncharacterized protein (TIGR02145 family)